MKKAEINKDLIRSVARRVGISLDLIDNDWHATMARAKDAERLIYYYDKFDNPDEKSVLMWFILAAYDKYLQASENGNKEPAPVLEKGVIKCLRENWKEHEDAVEYWSLFDYGDGVPVDESDAFFVTPLMRKLWNERKTQAI